MNLSASLLKKYSFIFPVGNAKHNISQILRDRRKKHLQHLQHPCLFVGVPKEPGSENVWHMNALRLYQEPALTYLTGVNQPEIYLLLQPHQKKSAQSILFIPYKDPKKEFWDGIRFGYTTTNSNNDLSILKTLTGIENIKPTSELFKTLRSLSQNTTSIHLFYHEYLNTKGKIQTLKTDHNYAFYQKLKKTSFTNIIPFSQKHFDLRLPLDSFQIKDVQKANQLTKIAFIKVLQNSNNYQTEHDLTNQLEFYLKEKSTFGLSFPSIVASGKNATTLHYLKNDEKISKTSLILMDFGIRYGTMHADISRTFPYNGKFNPLQKLLYNLVYKTLRFNQKNAKSGVTIAKLNQDSWSFLEKLLQKDFISKGGIVKRSYKTMPHGISHLMGEQEHDGDPFGIYKDEPMKEGWQISNEPGLYGYFSLKIKNKQYKEWIGIRIEDNLLIRKKDCFNFSKNFPTTIAQIEKQMNHFNTPK